MFVRGVIMIAVLVVTAFRDVVVMSIIFVAVRVDQFGVVFLVAQFDQVSTVRTMSRVSVSGVRILISVLIVVC